MNKSKIKKGIVRGIQTKKFEQVTITVETEEIEVEWKDLKERQRKTDKITEMLLDDFRKTYNEVVTTLGVDNICIGVVEVKGEKPSDNEIDMFD